MLVERVPVRSFCKNCIGPPGKSISNAPPVPGRHSSRFGETQECEHDSVISVVFLHRAHPHANRKGNCTVYSASNTSKGTLHTSSAPLLGRHPPPLQ